LLFLYNWFGLVNNDYRMKSVKFRRWLIEALSAPVLLLGALFSHYIGCIDIFFDEYQSFYINAFMIKVPLFFLTRYAESQPDFVLNEWEASISLRNSPNKRIRYLLFVIAFFHVYMMTIKNYFSSNKIYIYLVY